MHTSLPATGASPALLRVTALALSLLLLTPTAAFARRSAVFASSPQQLASDFALVNDAASLAATGNVTVPLLGSTTLVVTTDYTPTEVAFETFAWDCEDVANDGLTCTEVQPGETLVGYTCTFEYDDYIDYDCTDDTVDDWTCDYDPFPTTAAVVAGATSSSTVAAGATTVSNVQNSGAAHGFVPPSQATVFVSVIVGVLTGLAAIMAI